MTILLDGKRVTFGICPNCAGSEREIRRHDKRRVELTCHVCRGCGYERRYISVTPNKS